MTHHSTFAYAEFAAKKKRTRRERFLARMEEVIPWTQLLAVIAPHYPKGEHGRPPIGLERMLRVYFLQQWYALADEALEDALYDSQVLQRFARRFFVKSRGAPREMLNGRRQRKTDRQVARFFQNLLELKAPWRVVAVELKEAERSVEIEVEWPDSHKVPCAECGRACAVYDHAGVRWWRHLGTINRMTRTCSRVPRSDCPEHGVKTVAVPWAGARSHFTVEFETQTIDLLLLARSQSQAVRHLELTWHQVHDVQTAAVERGLERRSLEEIERVGLDEKSFGHGHHYGTVLSDLDHNRVLEVVEHREQASAEQAFHVLPAAQLAKIKVVALDMWLAFMGAAEVTVPQADLVHDRFHVVKHLNDAVDVVRKQEHAELFDTSHDWLTGKKYLFLKNPAAWKAEEK